MADSGDTLVLHAVPENPFLLDLVVLVMFEETDWETLKTLREMNSDWNHLYIKEMGKRASEGRLSQINFTLDWGNKIITVEQIQAQLDAFLKDTQKNPQIFKSFYFNFPESFNHCIDPSFLSTYSPAFVKIGVSESVGFPENQLRHILRLMAPHLMEFKVGYLSEWWIPEVSPRASSSWTIQDQGKDLQLIFPKLTTLSSEGFLASELVCRQLFVSKGGLVDPTPKLHNLDLPMKRFYLDMMASDQLNSIGRSRWSRITRLHISQGCGYEEESIKLTENLLSMAQVGMKLKYLGLEIGFATDWPAICRNLSHFFEFQSKSLETLKFHYRSWPIPEIVDMRIKLPIFKELITLELKVYFDLKTPKGFVIKRIFEMGPLPVHCPKLINLSVNSTEMLATLYPDDVNAERIHLQKLYIGYFNWDFRNMRNFWIDWLESKFSSVVELSCPSEIVAFGRRPLRSWADSLKVLKINSVDQPLKISHLKGLEELYLNEGSYRSFAQDTEEYFGFFHRVREIKLSKITIVFGEMITEDVKAKLENYFPFPVKYLDRKDYLEGF